MSTKPFQLSKEILRAGMIRFALFEFFISFCPVGFTLSAKLFPSFFRAFYDSLTGLPYHLLFWWEIYGSWFVHLIGKTHEALFGAYPFYLDPYAFGPVIHTFNGWMTYFAYSSALALALTAASFAVLRVRTRTH